jgi:hypothetical protein
MVPDDREDTGIGRSLRELRSDQSIDQSFENLLRALTLNLELRARYRVFEFEASQDGHPELVRLFGQLRRVEGKQIADLIAGLRARLGALELAAHGEITPTEVAK